MANSSPVVIVADDRTGALETAGRIAQRTGGVVEVRCLVDGANVQDVVGSPEVPICVVDIASRHLGDDRRIRRLAEVISPGWRVLHKVDSLLRGNWDIEVMSLCAHLQRPVVMVPALPEAGRTCVGGVVRAVGEPVDLLTDARGAARTSRPATLLGGAEEVDIQGLDDWLAEPDWIVVCDAATDGDIDAIAELLDEAPDVIVSGTAEVLANVVAGRPVDAVDPPALDLPWLVIVGSVHHLAIAQAEAVEGHAGVTVLRSKVGKGQSADEVIGDLADRALPLLGAAKTVVIVGGDTAAAVLGEVPMEVHGMVGPGMPWLYTSALPGAVVVTKPGSHGEVATLLDLLSARMQS